MANTTGKKYGGRTKGTPNEVTEEFRDMVKTIVQGNMETVQEDFKALSPDKRIKYNNELLKFVLPTLKAQELNINPELPPIQISFID